MSLTQEHIDKYQGEMNYILAEMEKDPTLFADLSPICNRDRWIADATYLKKVLNEIVFDEPLTREQVGVLLKVRMLPIAFNMMFNSHQNSKPLFGR